MAWAVTQAKAKFSEVLDKAEAEGPQLVRRRKREFYVMTREQRDADRTKSSADKPFVSAWDALTPSSGIQFDLEIPARTGKARAANF